MRKLELYHVDFHGVKTPYQFHETFKTALDFPAYYGMNLSALEDCLTERPGSLIYIHGLKSLPEKLHQTRTIEGLYEIFDELPEEYPETQFILVDEPATAEPFLRMKEAFFSKDPEIFHVDFHDVKTPAQFFERIQLQLMVPAENCADFDALGQWLSVRNPAIVYFHNLRTLPNAFYTSHFLERFYALVKQLPRQYPQIQFVLVD